VVSVPERYDQASPTRPYYRSTYALVYARDGPLAGVRSVGHAIKNQSGIPFAALSVSTISSRMTEKRVIEIAALLKNEARLIEKQLSNAM